MTKKEFIQKATNKKELLKLLDEMDVSPEYAYIIEGEYLASDMLHDLERDLPTVLDDSDPFYYIEDVYKCKKQAVIGFAVPVVHKKQ